LGMPRCTFIFQTGKPKKGLAKGHAKGKVPSIPDYSIISRRINRLDTKINENNSMEFEDDYMKL
jgi:hypothetical protein